MAKGDAGDRTICLTGPESTGKTTLARALAAELAAPLVPEIARDYLAGRVSYAQEDVLEIARLQREAERQARATHRGLLLCDTDDLVIRIWWREKYGAPPAELAPPETSTASCPRGYLLLSPDVPWERDPLRENPLDRDRLFALQRQALRAAAAPYRVVAGRGPARGEHARTQLHSLLRELSAAEGRGA